MIILGVVLLVLAVLLVLGTVFSNGQAVPGLDVFGVSLQDVSAGGLFLGGVVTGAVAMLALSLIFGGGVRKRHKAVERKRAVKGARSTASQLEQENAELRERLAAERAPAGPRAGDQSGSAAV